VWVHSFSCRCCRRARHHLLLDVPFCIITNDGECSPTTTAAAAVAGEALLTSLVTMSTNKDRRVRCISEYNYNKEWEQAEFWMSNEMTI
jgi:hypothetical protein